MKRVIAAFAALLAPLAQGFAEDWPSRPITMVIPLAAGGGSDGLIRVFTPRLGELLGQQVIVENAGGAGGMIGAARVAKAPPDGYQLLLGTSGTQALNQSIYERPLYNAATDFAPVALIFEVPQVLLARKISRPATCRSSSLTRGQIRRRCSTARPARGEPAISPARCSMRPSASR